jgi:hypothetical protein
MHASFVEGCGYGLHLCTDVRMYELNRRSRGIPIDQPRRRRHAPGPLAGPGKDEWTTQSFLAARLAGEMAGHFLGVRDRTTSSAACGRQSCTAAPLKQQTSVDRRKMQLPPFYVNPISLCLSCPSLLISHISATLLPDVVHRFTLTPSVYVCRALCLPRPRRISRSTRQGATPTHVWKVMHA